ncbi:hypothetical protein JCM10212_004787 [Sporobolomyces blumeae]
MRPVAFSRLSLAPLVFSLGVLFLTPLASLSSTRLVVDTRTTTFSPRDSDVSYRPEGAWSETGSRGMKTLTKGATVTLKFAGEQVTLYGSTSSTSPDDLSASLDTASSISTLSVGTRSASPQKVYQASNLDAEQDHEVTIRLEEDVVFVLDRIAVAVSSSVELDPVLRPAFVASTSSATSLPASPSSSKSSSGLSLNDQLEQTSSTPPSAGTVVGATLGSLVGIALLVALGIYLCRRARSREQGERRDGEKRDPSSYVDHDTGQRRSSIVLTAFRRTTSRLSIPLAIPPRTPIDPSSAFATPTSQSYGVAFGTTLTPHSSRPFNSLDPTAAILRTPTPVLIGSETWQNRLARAASWKRKTERLAETRRFYRVGNANGRGGLGGGGGGAREGEPAPSGPPPAMPLPKVPGSTERVEPREMEERWRTDGPSLVVSPRQSQVQSRLGGISPYLYSTPPLASSNELVDVPHGTTQAYGQAISSDRVSPGPRPPPPQVHVVSFDPSVQHIPSNGRGNFDDRMSIETQRTDKPLPRGPFDDAECVSSDDGDFTMSNSTHSHGPAPDGARPHPYAYSRRPHDDDDYLYQNPFTLAHSVTDSTDSDFTSSVEAAEIATVTHRLSSTTDLNAFATVVPTPLPTSCAVSRPVPSRTFTKTTVKPTKEGVYGTRRCVPVRSSSMRLVVGTVGSGPRGDVRTVEGDMGVERRPSVIKRDNATRQRGSDVCDGQPFDGDGGRNRHQSLAGMIETLDDDAAPTKDESVMSRSRKSRRRAKGSVGSVGSDGPRSVDDGGVDASIGSADEDRPGYFVQRDVVPRYGAEADPRVATLRC